MKCKFPISWVDEIDSTNSALLRDTDKIPSGTLLAARHQTAGRGQRGNSWKDAAEDNLTFSIMLKPGKGGIPEVKAREQFVLSEAASLAVRDLLRGEGAGVRIKWPNDIYFRDRKICGMLLENGLDADRIAFSVVGIGININQSDFSPELLNPVSLKKITGRNYNTELLLEKFADIFAEKISLSATPEGREALKADYLDGLYRLEEEASYTDCTGGGVFRGRIKGITDIGRLLVEMPDGKIRDFGFKEISYII